MHRVIYCFFKLPFYTLLQQYQSLMSMRHLSKSDNDNYMSGVFSESALFYMVTGPFVSMSLMLNNRGEAVEVDETEQDNGPSN